MSNVPTRRRFATYGLILVAVLVALWFGWRYLHPPQVTTAESYQEATTTPGVAKAAENAGVSLTTAHAGEIGKMVAEANEKPPDYTMDITGNNLKTALADIQQQGKADFQIVTYDPRKDSTLATDGKTVLTKDQVKAQTPNLNDIKDTDKINLAVNNIKAYPTAMTEWEVYLRGTEPVGGEVSRSWQIGKSGHYIGVGVSYDNDRQRGKVRETVKYTCTD